LQNEKDQPAGEDSGVNIEDPRPWYCRMEKIPAYGEAEAVYDHCDNQQRHEKVKILTQFATRRDPQGSRAGLTYVSSLCSANHNLRAILPQECGADLFALFNILESFLLNPPETSPVILHL
jgi:hypothetical protein